MGMGKMGMMGVIEELRCEPNIYALSGCSDRRAARPAPQTAGSPPGAAGANGFGRSSYSLSHAGILSRRCRLQPHNRTKIEGMRGCLFRASNGRIDQQADSDLAYWSERLT